MKKVIYIDVETTGLDPAKNGLIEVACIVEIDNKEVERFVFNINPFKYNKKIEIVDEALKVNGKTIEDLKSYPKSKKQYKKFIKFLDKYIDKMDKNDKFQPAGYNVSFDIKMLRAWFIDNGNIFFGSYFGHKDLDVFALVKHLTYSEVIKTKNEKLKTVCDYFKIEINAHNALDDIIATKKLHHLLINRFINDRGIDLDDTK